MEMWKLSLIAKNQHHMSAPASQYVFTSQGVDKRRAGSTDGLQGCVRRSLLVVMKRLHRGRDATSQRQKDGLHRWENLMYELICRDITLDGQR